MKKFFKLIGFASFIGIFYFGFTTYPKLDLISGFSAKSIASGHFIDHRSQEMIEKGDNDIDMIDLAENKIDEAGKFATASVYGLKERKAIYREGLGATLINDDFDENKPYEVPKRIKLNNNLPFPYGNNEPKDTLFSNIDYAKLNTAVANAFDTKRRKSKKEPVRFWLFIKTKSLPKNTIPVLIKTVKLLGWSMTKSITATMFGILEKQRKFDIDDPAPIPEWANDKRKLITTSDLLHMNSGLQWVEDYKTISDATKMLFQAEDMSRVQLEKQRNINPICDGIILRELLIYFPGFCGSSSKRIRSI